MYQEYDTYYIQRCNFTDENILNSFNKITYTGKLQPSA